MAKNFNYAAVKQLARGESKQIIAREHIESGTVRPPTAEMLALPFSVTWVIGCDISNYLPSYEPTLENCRNQL